MLCKLLHLNILRLSFQKSLLKILFFIDYLFEDIIERGYVDIYVDTLHGSQDCWWYNGGPFYFTKQLYTNVVFVLNINWPLGPSAQQLGSREIWSFATECCRWIRNVIAIPHEITKHFSCNSNQINVKKTNPNSSRSKRCWCLRIKKFVQNWQDQDHPKPKPKSNP